MYTKVQKIYLPTTDTKTENLMGEFDPVPAQESLWMYVKDRAADMKVPIALRIVAKQQHVDCYLRTSYKHYIVT